MKKYLSILGWIIVGYCVLNGLFFGLRDIHPMVYVVFSPVIITVIAKFISSTDESEGKMSREYKNRFPKNKLAFYTFGGMAAFIPMLISLEEFVDIRNILSDSVMKTGENVFFVLFALSGVVWIVSEVVRRDFPWGIFRVIERLFYLVLVGIGVFLVTKIFGPYLVYIVMGLLPVVMIGVVALQCKLMWEGLMVLMYPDPEKRKQAKHEMMIQEARRMEQERKNQEKWDNAKAKDFWGNPYIGRDQDGYRKKLRKTFDGTYVDKDGNEYTKVE